MHAERVVVVGGGIAGLTAAHEVLTRRPTARVLLVEGADRPGGKLRREEVAGSLVDVGAESVLARRPEALSLIEDLGLGDAVTHPATGGASVWSRGRLHPLPSGTVMGVPGDPAQALGLLTEAEVERALHEQVGAPVAAEDVSIGDFVADRLGDAVVDRLVEPLLGGVYAGHARRLSLRATVPQLWEAAAGGTSLLEAVGALAPRPNAAGGSSPAPVFAGLRGGIGVLAEELAADLERRGAKILTGTLARELHRTPEGWEVVTGPTRAPDRHEADAVLLAVPPRSAARLLRGHEDTASALLAEIEHASMAIVTLAFEADTVPHLTGTGFLVPPVDRRTVKASTFSSTKWPTLAASTPGVTYLRASIGRAGEEADLQREDEDLVRIALREVSEAIGASLPDPIDTHLQRWGGALPQYAVGHLGRVARIRSALARLPGVEVAGAAYEGVGIPAVIAGARSAAEAAVTHLPEVPGEGGE